MNARYGILLALAIGVAARTRAQDPHFTQFYATPTYLSPAFAGTTVQNRFALQFRDQWPAIPGAFVSFNFAADQYLGSLNSGIGVIATRDQAGSGALSSTKFALQYAYEIRLKHKVYLRPAMQFGYVSRSVDYSKLVFNDQLSRGGDLSTYAHFDGTKVGYADLGSGLLLFTPQLWFGLSVQHLNEPNQSLLLEDESLLPRQLNMHGGYRFKLRTGGMVRKDPQSIVAAFNYRAQGKFDQLDIGAYYERDPIFGGVWYRGLPLKAYRPGYQNNDAIALVAGFKKGDWRFGYSYDITISRLAINSGGAHEITTIYEFADKRKKKSMARRRVVPCAKF
ncbi:MAG: type IX secretion system membrane protein PorP/SprF [Flavobacteriales bacterium]|nr:type IX secretion system membrane protein PorP/SprF [Flavobacteriales bacterium]